MKKEELTNVRKAIKKALSIAMMIHLFAISAQGQSWSLGYKLFGDSTTYTLSRDKVIQGSHVAFFFPAYKYFHTSTNTTIESATLDNYEIIELAFDSNSMNFDNIHFEIDVFAEGIDTIQLFLKTTHGNLVPIILHIPAKEKEYVYLPTIYASVNLKNNEYSSIQIVGKSNKESRKLILGRLEGLRKIDFLTESMAIFDSLLQKYPEKQSDVFLELPRFLPAEFGYAYQLILKDCRTTYDSIQCISQYINQQLNDYDLYEVYGINKQELINRHIQLANTSNNLNSYYEGLREIIASLNSCHIGLSTNRQNNDESPLQSIYFYNINNNIAVAAVFDPLLEGKIHLGDQLLSINHIDVEQLYKDFSKNMYASTSHQREIKITQQLLYLAREKWGSNLSVDFMGKDGLYSILLNESNFSGRKIIPHGFKVFSDNVIEMYGNIAYFKPTFHASRIVPFIYSHQSNFEQCNGLILDLRGCSSGDHSVATLFSFLISENTLLIQADSNSDTIQSKMIVKPSKQFLVKSPIVILVDARTTCYAELLINALRKNRSDIDVIGATHTAGSAQFATSTFLPQNSILYHFEGTTKDAFGKLIDDNIGIRPDILMNFESYQDLFPYNDKIKRYALNYLGYTIEDNDKSQD